MENKYILRSNFHITKCEYFFKDDILKTKYSNKYILINSKTGKTFIINKQIRDFLILFKDSKEIDSIKKENISTRRFLFEMIKHRFLIAENKIKPNSYEIFSENIYIPADIQKYKNISILSNSNDVTVILANNSADIKYVYKYLKKHTTQYKSLRFDQEFNIMKLIDNHPSICKLIKYDKINKIAKLEYANGFSLNTLVENSLLNIKQKETIIYNILEAFSFIHSKNIVHGDIHSGQIIVDNKNNIKLIDFGFAYQINETHSKNKLYITRGGVNNYLEPESILPNIFDKYKRYTPSFKCDVYRIGVLLYFLLFEKYPFNGSSWKDLYENITNNKLSIENMTPKGEKISQVYIDILKLSLNRNPRFRFASAIKMFKYVNPSINEK